MLLCHAQYMATAEMKPRRCSFCSQSLPLGIKIDLQSLHMQSGAFQEVNHAHMSAW